MAEPNAQTSPAKPGDPSHKKSNKIGMYTLGAVIIVTSPLTMPYLVLTLIGLSPTIISLINDDDPQKSATVAMGSLNFAGIVPFLIDLWSNGQSLSYVFHLLKDPLTWCVMLGAAAVGKLIVFAIPSLLTAFTMVHYEQRLKSLKENLENIKTTWGPDVATTKPIDQLKNKP